jgi:hypothetical protein
MLGGEKIKGIVIGFTNEVQVSNTIDPDHVYQVLVDTTDPGQTGLVCRCAIRGRTIPVNLKLLASGRIDVNQQGRIDTADEEDHPGNARGVAFIPDQSNTTSVESNILTDPDPDATSRVFNVWIILRGDFVKDTNDLAIDAEFVRAELPTGNRPRPSVNQPLDEQLGIQGGLFESWFLIGQG